MKPPEDKVETIEEVPSRTLDERFDHLLEMVKGMVHEARGGNASYLIQKFDPQITQNIFMESGLQREGLDYLLNILNDRLLSTVNALE